MTTPAGKRPPMGQRSVTFENIAHENQSGSVTLGVEAEHAKHVAAVERDQRERREQIAIATSEGERLWEQLRESAQRIVREGRTAPNKTKGIMP